MKLTTTRKRLSRRAAFTLLEVLVVVAILVILATVASIAVTRNLDDAKKSQAHLKAAAIAKAMESYYISPNSGNTYPLTIQDLVSPSWGGSSFLNDPQADRVDPWGKEYQIQPAAAADGSTQGKPLVFTTSPDGVQISNHGIGNLARMQ